MDVAQEQKNGSIENYMPMSKRVEVSMSLADYEAERRRCRDSGYDIGYTKAQREIIYILTAVMAGEYGSECLDRMSDSFIQLKAEEKAQLKKLADRLYGTTLQQA